MVTDRTKHHLTLKLTERQAKLVWDIIDGARDAGADGGLTPAEQRTLGDVMGKMNAFILARAKRIKQRSRA